MLERTQLEQVKPSPVATDVAVGREEHLFAPGPNNVTLLTGGGDRPYAFDMAQALSGAGLPFDFIGSDDLESPELQANPLVRFLNLRGDQRPDAPPAAKVRRVAAYYVPTASLRGRNDAADLSHSLEQQDRGPG